MKLKRTVVAPLLVAGMALVSGGWLLQAGVSGEQSVFQRARLFDEVLRFVETRFVEPHSTPELYRKAVDGLLRELGDPHTTFMTADEYAQLHLQTTGEYGGLGIQIAPRDGWITVVGVLPETPAERAGMRVGDRFLEINGESARGWTDDRAVKELRGPRGSPANVKVQRVGVPDPIEFTIVRDEIHVRSVPVAYVMDGGVGYVSLVLFQESSTQELRAAIDRLRREGARSLVLDLRNNPGGLLDQGVAISDLFLTRGQSIVETRARDPRESAVLRAMTPEAYPDLPLVVLVDDYSASASEIVAGALQDHDRALVIGSPTFGKGSVQSLFPLSGGNFLKMTTARWYTPVGRSIQRDHAAGGDGDPTAQQETAAVGEDGAPVLEDTVQRQPYRTDGGRVVFGGGGIVPDLVVRQDTLMRAEREFFATMSQRAADYQSVLLRYAVEYERARPNLRPDFPVTEEMHREFHRRLRAAGFDVSWEQYLGAERLVTQQLVQEIVSGRFGAAAVAMRRDTDDRPLQEAAALLRAAADQPALFRAAEARAGSLAAAAN
jgi:carboxyl-terminal processing protease